MGRDELLIKVSLSKEAGSLAMTKKYAMFSKHQVYQVFAFAMPTSIFGLLCFTLNRAISQI